MEKIEKIENSFLTHKVTMYDRVFYLVKLDHSDYGEFEGYDSSGVGIDTFTAGNIKDLFTRCREKKVKEEIEKIEAGDNIDNRIITTNWFSKSLGLAPVLIIMTFIIIISLVTSGVL